MGLLYDGIEWGEEVLESGKRRHHVAFHRWKRVSATHHHLEKVAEIRVPVWLYRWGMGEVPEVRRPALHCIWTGALIVSAQLASVRAFALVMGAQPWAALGWASMAAVLFGNAIYRVRALQKSDRKLK